MKHLALLLAGFALSSATLQAQSSSDVPDSHRPPPGMCRIWIDGVPPTHQPAPTDCATAIRKRPMNARVVFGNDASPGSQRPFAPAHPGQSNFAAPGSQSTPNVQSTPAVSHEEQDRSAQRQEQDRQRIAAQQEAQRVEAQRAEAQRAEAQRVHDEQARRAAHHDAPPAQHGNQDHAAPSPRARPDHQARPPRPSFSARRPR